MSGKLKSMFGVIVLVALVAFQLYQKWSDQQIPESDGQITRMSEGQFSDKFTPVKTSGAGLELLKGCRLITGRNSDGDSFHVQHPKGENEFRLYFVDTPESEYKEYRNGEDKGKRLDEQGAYFNGMDRVGAAAVGKDAKAFVLGLLKKEDFKVLTKWENVHRDKVRFHGFVIVKWEGKEVYLHELLVAEGLGRIHTWGADLPGGKAWKAQRGDLEKWEKEVKKAGIGAWGFQVSEPAST